MIRSMQEKGNSYRSSRDIDINLIQRAEIRNTEREMSCKFVGNQRSRWWVTGYKLKQIKSNQVESESENDCTQRYCLKYSGLNQPTLSYDCHNLLALLTSILQACWASVLRNSLPIFSAAIRAWNTRRLLQR
jgi:hypothetical protein